MQNKYWNNEQWNNLSPEVTLESIGAAASEHKNNHMTGGADALTASDIGAAATTHTQDDTTVSLTDTTKALFGMTGTKFVSDALGIIAPYATSVYSWIKQPTVYPSNPNPVYNTTLSSSDSPSTSYNILYSDKVYWNGTAWVLYMPSTVSISYNTYSNANVLAGKYFYDYQQTTTILYGSPSGVATQSTLAGPTYRAWFSLASISLNSSFSLGTVTTVTATTRNAYPDIGTNDGIYNYKYSGSVSPSKIATGSYTGTGTYGSGNPNSIAISMSSPRLVVVSSRAVGYPISLIMPYAVSSSSNLLNGISTLSSTQGSISHWYEAGFVKWYNTYADPWTQANLNNQIYDYTIIGI